MHILYYGVFDGKRWRSEYAMRDGLLAAGQTLTCVNFRSRLPGTVRRGWRRHKDQIDLVFLQNGIPFKSPWLSDILGRPLVFHASEFAVASARHILDAPRPPDLVLAHSEQTCQYALSKGLTARRVHHAYDARYYRRLDLPYRYDAAFVGSLNARRRAFLDPIRRALGDRLFIGEVWNPEAINALYNQSKVVLHVHAGEQSYLPTRFFEVLPTRGVLLIEDLGENLSEDLRPLNGKAFHSFSGAEHCLSQLLQLLEDVDERQQVLDAAWAAAPDHSWEARMRSFVTLFEEAKQAYQP